MSKVDLNFAYEWTRKLEALGMGLFGQPNERPVDGALVEPVNVRRWHHGGRREHAGRKKTRSNADRQRAYRKRVTALRNSSL